MSKMPEVTYMGKKIKLPCKDADYTLDGDNEVEIENPYSGQKTFLPGFAVAVYDVTTGYNSLAEAYDRQHGYGKSKAWKDVRKGLGWFRRHFPEQYMVLLD